jgi:hypothetical protein
MQRLGIKPNTKTLKWYLCSSHRSASAPSAPALLLSALYPFSLAAYRPRVRWRARTRRVRPSSTSCRGSLRTPELALRWPTFFEYNITRRANTFAYHYLNHLTTASNNCVHCRE